MTDEEIEKIASLAAEKALLALPEVVGRLMQTQAVLGKMAMEFYDAYPELKQHKDIVSSVIEEIETNNPGLEYSKILELSLPIIKDRLKIKQSLNMTSVGQINRSLAGRLPDYGDL